MACVRETEALTLSGLCWSSAALGEASVIDHLGIKRGGDAHELSGIYSRSWWRGGRFQS
jgi:hypothetical protein